MPATHDRRIQLLTLIGPNPQYAGISIFAYEYKGKNWTDAKGILRHELDQDLYTGVEELHGLSKTTIDGHQFYYFETRKGVAQHEELATDLNGYVLLVVLEANDPQMVKLLSFRVLSAQVFSCPGSATARWSWSRRLRWASGFVAAPARTEGVSSGRAYGSR